jgi:hypothetical protein
MEKEIKAQVTPEQLAEDPSATKIKDGSSRRSFLGQLGGAAAATVAASAFVGPFAKSAKAAEGHGNPTLQGTSEGDARPPQNSGPARANKAQNLRTLLATRERAVALPPHTISGDEALYPDKSATYTKGLLQDSYGVVNRGAWASFKTAINSGLFSDWQSIITGGPRTQNGPMGSYAFTLEGTDSAQFGNAPSPANQQGQVVVPPFAQVTTADWGTQMIEMYWGSFLRDVAFTDYPTNSTAIAAAAELSNQSTYRGPRDPISGQVTPDLLFRGAFAGETVGPYMSQLMITPTSFGQQPISQQMTTYVAGVDYMKDLNTWFQVQNGISTGLTLQKDPTLRYLRNGRDLGAWTHADVLYQGYFIGLLVMLGLAFPLNPGVPYVGSTTQNGFGTFGGPDFAACLGEIAHKALDVVWWQKWLAHLTQRPESGGGLVHLKLSGLGGAQAKNLNSNVLNSQGAALAFSTYGTWLLSQAFPEGSPTHPSYPTGHGTVGGACITLLKFFFDQNHVWPNPMVPSSDGLSLEPYTGSDAGLITVGTELNKLARNITMGHGVHSGIHWRSDSDASMVLGETYAISMLQDKALAYAEPFTISFTKLDGTTCTITNQ